MSACEQLLRDHRAEVNAGGFLGIEFLDDQKTRATPDQIDVDAGIDHVFFHKTFSTPPFPATLRSDSRISSRKTTRSKAASTASVSVLAPRIFLARRIFLWSR